MYTVNVLWLITRDQAARLTFVHRPKALSRAQHFGLTSSTRKSGRFIRKTHNTWQKELQSDRKRKTAKFRLWNRKKQETVWSASESCGWGDHPGHGDRFARIDTRSKFIAMGRRLEFSAVRSYSQKLVSLTASQPPLQTGRKWLKIRTVSGPKYTDQMGPLRSRWQPE